jgi:hypothetical protein
MPKMTECVNGCGRQVRAAESKTGLCRECYDAAITVAEPEFSAPEQVAADRDRKKLANELKALKEKYASALTTIEDQQMQLSALVDLDSQLETYTIEPRVSGGHNEGVPVAVLSDVHYEEFVGREMGGLNYATLDIMDSRMKQYWQSLLRLLQLLNNDIRVERVVLALLGDFITNDIHGAENAEKNQLPPMFAIAAMQNHLISGIQFLLDNTSYEFVIPCHSGNHARTTQFTRFGTENGHSLEYLMYLHIAAHFKAKGEARVQFIIPEGMHSYLEIYGKIIRFHHGHALKYQGGVGGLYIPTNKAIAQWNKARYADLDVFGHFHQLRDGGNFICNGSLIGYNAYALSIKADFELPKQALFLMDKKRGRTCTWPILVQ